MCFGLQNKSYCLLNMQYSPEEYFSYVDKIKSEMMIRGEYGDGVGIRFSAQAYNFSHGQISFPLNSEEIIKLGGYVAEEPESNAGDVKTLSASEVPQTIDETTDDILNYGIICEVTKKPFRITPSELQFYRKMKLPIPTIHPVVRMEEKTAFIPMGVQYKTSCAKCKKEILSAFNPKIGFLLYCEDCYKQEVY